MQTCKSKRASENHIQPWKNPLRWFADRSFRNSDSSTRHPRLTPSFVPCTLRVMKKIILLAVVTLLAAICYAQSQGAKSLVLEKNEGETRVRRPRGALATPSAEFILKVTPENSGSKHLVLGTEVIPPGGVIPKHKHLEQDEILLIQTGTAHVTLDDKEYDVHAGGTVFFPAQTWVSLKNTGADNINVVFIFSAPGFEKNMRCSSVAAGQTASPINADELKACAHEGHVEYEALAPAGTK